MPRSASRPDPTSAAETPAGDVVPMTRRRRLTRLLVAAISIGVIFWVGWYVVYPMWAVSRHLDRAKLAFADFDTLQAYQQLLKVIELKQDHAEAYYLLARTFRQMEKYREFYDAFDVAKELGWPEELLEVERLLRSAQQYGPSGEVEKRLQVYITSSHPEDRAMLEGLIRGYISIHQLADALRWLDIWIDRYPDDWLPHLWRGDVHFVFRDIPKAIEDIQFVIRKKPNHRSVHAKLGNIYLSTKKNDNEAKEEFDRELQIVPDDVTSLLGLTECALNRGETAKALEHAEHVLKIQPNNVLAICQKARVLASTNPDQAIELLRRAEKLNPTEIHVLTQLGEVLTQLKKPEEAKPYLEKQKLFEVELAKTKELMEKIAREPRNPEHRLQLGQSLQAMDRNPEALNWYQSALKEDPQNIPTLEAMARFYEIKEKKPVIAKQIRDGINQIRAMPKK